jgi:hypothetical protein
MGSSTFVLSALSIVALSRKFFGEFDISVDLHVLPLMEMEQMAAASNACVALSGTRVSSRPCTCAERMPPVQVAWLHTSRYDRA